LPWWRGKGTQNENRYHCRRRRYWRWKRSNRSVDPS
jgi:hypothetical protein